MDASIAVIIIFLPILAIVAGAAIAIVGMQNRAKLKELKYRERIAMIEKGLVPPPEVDPRGFEDMMASPSERDDVVAAYNRAARHRTAGILFVGLGFALMFIIGLAAGALQEGLGIGGAVVILGLAFLANGRLAARDTYRGGQRLPPPSARTTDRLG